MKRQGLYKIEYSNGMKTRSPHTALPFLRTELDALKKLADDFDFYVKKAKSYKGDTCRKARPRVFDYENADAVQKDVKRFTEVIMFCERQEEEYRKNLIDNEKTI